MARVLWLLIDLPLYTGLISGGHPRQPTSPSRSTAPTRRSLSLIYRHTWRARPLRTVRVLPLPASFAVSTIAPSPPVPLPPPPQKLPTAHSRLHHFLCALAICLHLSLPLCPHTQSPSIPLLSRCFLPASLCFLPASPCISFLTPAPTPRCQPPTPSPKLFLRHAKRRQNTACLHSGKSLYCLRDVGHPDAVNVRLARTPLDRRWIAIGSPLELSNELEYAQKKERHCELSIDLAI